MNMQFQGELDISSIS